jgi:hypothetical protein
MSGIAPSSQGQMPPTVFGFLLNQEQKCSKFPKGSFFYSDFNDLIRLNIADSKADSQFEAGTSLAF